MTDAERGFLDCVVALKKRPLLNIPLLAKMSPHTRDLDERLSTFAAKPGPAGRRRKDPEVSPLPCKQDPHRTARLCELNVYRPCEA